MEEKLHHKEISLFYYLLSIFLIKIGYYVYFYIIHSPDKISWRMIIFYYLVMGILFGLSCSLMREKRQTIYDMHWTMMLWGSELILYIATTANYYLILKKFMVQLQAYSYVACIEGLLLLIFNILTIYISFNPTMKRGWKYIITFIVFLILSIFTQGYVMKTIYEIGIKNINQSLI